MAGGLIHNSEQLLGACLTTRSTTPGIARSSATSHSIAAMISYRVQHQINFLSGGWGPKKTWSQKPPKIWRNFFLSPLKQNFIRKNKSAEAAGCDATTTSVEHHMVRCLLIRWAARRSDERCWRAACWLLTTAKHDQQARTTHALKEARSQSGCVTTHAPPPL